MNKTVTPKHLTLRKSKAFTMIELMIVIAIVAVLSAVMVPKFKTARIESLNRGVEKNAENIVGVVENYLGRSINTSVTDTMLKTELDKQGLTNPASKSAAAYSIVTALPAVGSQVKGTIYIVVTVGTMATDIEGVTLHKIGVDGTVLGTVNAGSNN